MRLEELKRVDWTAEALALARFVTANLTKIGRGSMPSRWPDMFVVFGIDGKDEAIGFMSYLGSDDWVHGFAVDPANDRCWAMLIEATADDPDGFALNFGIWMTWAGGFESFTPSLCAQSDRAFQELRRVANG
jgi:hypothetical protein